VKHDYDFIAIGSGPAGQRAAIQAAKVGARAAIVEANTYVGGVSINTGTLPSKTLRAAVIDLSGVRQRRLYGLEPGHKPTLERLLSRTRRVVVYERGVVKAQLERNGVDLLAGTARFEGPHRLSVTLDGQTKQVTAQSILVAVGTLPDVPPGIAVDHERILTSEDILNLKTLPREVVIAGAGAIGLEYATMLAVLGSHVVVCDPRGTFLAAIDREIAVRFRGLLTEIGVQFRLGERMMSVRGGERLTVELQNGDRLSPDAVLVAAGRQGNTARLQLQRAGLAANERGHLPVNASFQTAVPYIYAAGDVIGNPQLASTSAEQGRLAACHALGIPTDSAPDRFPYGIYAIPEIAWVGKCEQDLESEGVAYEVGRAQYKEIARGTILGDGEGLLKLLVHARSHEILGVWVLGAQATELVHIGQAVMSLGGRLDYFLRTVFNYPTLAECYKVAALDGINKLRAVGRSFHPPQPA